MKNNPLLSETKPMFQVSSNWLTSPGLSSSGYQCLHHMPIWEYLAYENFLGSPHRCLDHHHTSSPSFTKTWIVHSSNLLYAETADAKCSPRTLTFDEDDVYTGDRTCSRKLVFFFLCPLVNPTCLFTFVSKSFFSLSHFQNGQDTLPNLAANSPKKNSPWIHLYFSPNVTQCIGDRLRALLQQSLSCFSMLLAHSGTPITWRGI